MAFTSFEQLINKTRNLKSKKRLIVAPAQATHALEAAIMAYDAGVVEPVFVGDKAKIIDCLHSMNEERSFEIVDVADIEGAMQKAVDIINAGEGHILLKGIVETGDLLRVLFKKENNMRTANIVSAVHISQIETYHKLIATTDAVINTYPNLEQKRVILENAVGAMNRMGWDCPKVGILASVEKVNPKMPDTLDAAELKRMNQEGVIRNCIVEGPIAFDLAIDKDSAKEKNYNSPVAGDADLLVYPDLTSANIGIKTIICTGHNISGNIVVGLKVPTVLSSRGASAGTKLRGIILGATMA